jgi:hypothetical protein
VPEVVPGRGQKRDGREALTTTRTAEIWRGEDGFIHIQPFARTQQDLPDAVENMKGVARAAGGTPRPLIVHWQQASSLTPACRAHYMAPEALTNITAVAVVTSSMLGRILGNLMMGMTNRVRVRLFEDEGAAAEWLSTVSASKKSIRA